MSSDPTMPSQTPDAPVSDPSVPGAPESEQLDDYDEAEAESFPASDPPSQSEPGV